MTILTAQEFIAQGTSAGAIMSIASVNPLLRRQLEATAQQVADRTGQTLQIPGALTHDRNSRRRPSNDNARSGGKKVAA